MRSQSVRMLAIASLFAFFAALPAVAQDLDAVEIISTEVATGVYMFEGTGGNLGVSAGDDGVFMVDDQFAPLTEKIKAAVAKISDEPVRFVINTHWHFDHTGGNENLGKEGVVIVAHDNVRQRMSTGQMIEALGMEVPAAPHVALPVITFADSVTFHLNGQTMHAFHVPPAHTDGDSIIHFQEADVVHMGDLYFNGMYPFIDVSSGGHVDGVIGAADKVLSLGSSDLKIIPGHGPLSNKAELTVYRDMLRSVRAAVAKLVADGKTREEVVAASPSAAYDEVWGGGFRPPAAFVESVFDSLKK